ncbi:carbamoyltransferase [Vibrio gazogenes]|uniref:Carbamoyltransferase n=1 Tax=Vibrio gazogenes DSM 21264 = NBRC 103151 TaxID=1123492 RepID=A0A1M5FKI3_VIBGA|nr:carbamoyltransferase [Vibrio gazogenes]USP14470.1 carbamoyltransferase [Vibrio gazogenes]SHF91939.1 carbamoyltransferase [Vibrio gazogenes DSM 21264] [Vibrio gazogenes DSM 21264 = NBRC 103151]SJN57448.1 Decarbamoylnovobiocin carbamoyltransferase [Vibrio gazogenes]
MTYILGISAFYHDSAVALLRDGEILSAVQEERFSRVKNDDVFPKNAMEWILQQHNVTMEHIDYVIFYEKPFNKFERILETCIRFAPRGYQLFSHAIPIWLKEKLFQKVNLKKQLIEFKGGELWNQKLLFSDHHLSHSAAAFYPSPFESAAILTIDGVGEWATTTVAIGSGQDIRRIKEMSFPHSLGMLYSAITAFLGFKVNSGEYKIMGLAPYGQPVYSTLIKENLVNIKSDGSFRLNMKYFRFATELRMYSPELERLFGISARQPESCLEQVHMDIAASIQEVTDEIFLALARYVRELTGEVNLCLAGGVALNCAAAGKVLKSGVFERIWIQPAAGDAGSALGAAQVCHHMYLQSPRTPASDYMPYLGPAFEQDTALAQLDNMDAEYRLVPDEQLFQLTADALADGKIIAWFQGKAEFSPRALGNRSILADPRVPDLKRELNLKIKYRESFRPFAPVILEEYASEWFDIEGASPHMNFIYTAKDGVNHKLPSVIHVDGTARLQTVSERTNQRFYQLMKQFYEITGCPVLVNTSLNVRGEPMVLSPEDAFNCFMNTEIDMLVIGNIVLDKHKQRSQKYQKYNYELD